MKHLKNRSGTHYFKKSAVLCIAMLLIISLCLPSAAYAMDSISTTEMIIPPTAEEAAAAVNASNYSIAPLRYYPFIYDGTSPALSRDINTSGCVENYLYVHDSVNNSVTAICTNPVLTFTTTADHIFYVTSEQKFYQSDYNASFHTELYQSNSSDIQCLDYYNGKLVFIEQGLNVVVLDVATGVASTVFASKDLKSIYFFADNKFIWRNTNGNPFYYNIATNVNVALANEMEVNRIIAPYITPVQNGQQAEINTSSLNTNDIVFPLPEYPATQVPFTGFNDFPTAQSYFSNGTCNHPDNDDPSGDFNCRNYAGSNQCDGFAKYAHDRYYHITNNLAQPSFAYGDIVDDSEKTCEKIFSSADAVRDLFLSVNIGAFIRYGDISSETNSCVECHSIVVSSQAQIGAYVYECNQDYKCGVFYTYYSYQDIANNYHCARYYVNHELKSAASIINMSNISADADERHIRQCDNCAGYLLEKHTSSVYNHALNASQHAKRASCCGYYEVVSHNYSTRTKSPNNKTNHKYTYGCCGYTWYENHDSSTLRHYPYSTTQHLVTYLCCGYETYENHFFSGTNPECQYCGDDPYYVNKVETKEGTE